MSILELRREYHRGVCTEIIRVQHDGTEQYPNFADKGNRASRAIAWGIADRLGYAREDVAIAGQTAGGRFEVLTQAFLESGLVLLRHLRPGQWVYSSTADLVLRPVRSPRAP